MAWIGALTLALVPVPAAAQEAAAPETLLRVSATGSVQTPPDRLVAALVVQVGPGDAREVQRGVNSMMDRGMRTAQGTDGIEARAHDYVVTHDDDKRITWTAQQTLELSSADGQSLLELVRFLQIGGFTVASLDWRLSPATQRKAAEEATGAALKRLQEQAQAAAGALGLRVAYLKEVRIEPQVRPFRPAAAIMAARASPPPQASATDQETVAEVSADVVLRR